MRLRKMTNNEIDQVNALIPFSIKYADILYDQKSESGKWSRAFMEKMNEYTTKAGFRIGIDDVLAKKGGAM